MVTPQISVSIKLLQKKKNAPQLVCEKNVADGTKPGDTKSYKAKKKDNDELH